MTLPWETAEQLVDERVPAVADDRERDVARGHRQLRLSARILPFQGVFPFEQAFVGRGKRGSMRDGRCGDEAVRRVAVKIQRSRKEGDVTRKRELDDAGIQEKRPQLGGRRNRPQAPLEYKQRDLPEADRRYAQPAVLQRRNGQFLAAPAQ